MFFAISFAVLQAQPMTQPLALVLYERLLPGSQLVNRLQDLNYRVQTITDPELLVQCAEQAKPMLVLADLEYGGKDVCGPIARLKKNPGTQHLPVLAFGAASDHLRASAQAAGVTLLVNETALLNHLREFLEQALQLE